MLPPRATIALLLASACQVSCLVLQAAGARPRAVVASRCSPAMSMEEGTETEMVVGMMVGAVSAVDGMDLAEGVYSEAVADMAAVTVVEVASVARSMDTPGDVVEEVAMVEVAEVEGEVAMVSEDCPVATVVVCPVAVAAVVTTAVVLSVLYVVVLLPLLLQQLVLDTSLATASPLLVVELMQPSTLPL